MDIKNYSLVEDLSKITTIPKNSLAKLSNVSQEIIASNVCETILDSKDSITEIDIGIGLLYISVRDSIEYKFIPSVKFEALLRDVALTKRDPLITDVEENIVKKITNTYKDLL